MLYRYVDIISERLASLLLLKNEINMEIKAIQCGL